MPIFQYKVRLTPSRSGRVLLAALVLAAFTAGCRDNMSRAYGEAARAQALLDAGDLGGARQSMMRALAWRDDQIDLLLLDARIKYKMNDVGAAFNAYNVALAIDPNNPEALQAVSQLGLATGAQKDSADATDRILTADPTNAQALMIKGLIALNKRDFVGTRAIADQLLKLDPQSEPGLVLKARALTLAGDQKGALALLSAGLKRTGPTQMTVTALLETARDEQDPALMLQQFAVLRGLVPKNLDLALDEANVLYKIGRVGEARDRGWALLTDNGADARGVQRLVDLWSEYDGAPLGPGRLGRLASGGAAPARLAVARFYLARGDARTAGALAAGLPGDEGAGLRARVAYAAGAPDAAAAAEALLTGDKGNCDALAVRAAVAMRQGQPARAVVAAQSIGAECPDRDGYDLLARAYQAKGDAVGARRAFLEGARNRPLATEPVARYVAWLFARNDVDGAINNARSLTERAPAKISAWRLLHDTCARAHDAVCLGEATAGAAQARRNFAIDLPPGERRPSPLLGNSWR